MDERAVGRRGTCEEDYEGVIMVTTVTLCTACGDNTDRHTTHINTHTHTLTQTHTDTCAFNSGESSAHKFLWATSTSEGVWVIVKNVSCAHGSNELKTAHKQTHAHTIQKHFGLRNGSVLFPDRLF